VVRGATPKLHHRMETTKSAALVLQEFLKTKTTHRYDEWLMDLAGMTGFEPAVSTLTGSHVRPLHHIPVVC
jgi:hypothetical protein